MNQFVIWRCALRAGKPTLISIAVVYAAFLPQPAQAGWVQDGINWYNNQQQPQPNYYVQPSDAQEIQPISRDGFGYVNDLGRGTDEEGYYRQPIPSDRAFGSVLPDGTYEAPADWDRELGVQYQVEDGAIVNQQYRFYPGGQR